MKGRFRNWKEGLGIAALIAMAIYFLSVSWRKWPDPLIDFGRELYLPWRISNGAVLYRDVDDFYGPLSQYLNAGLFSLFGPGMMVLVTANLVIFAGIVATLYAVLRRAWRPLAAWTGSAVFIAVFGFSNYVSGNFTYAAPYAHEATHGILVCLLLAWTLMAWVDRPKFSTTAAVGLLLGLTALLKPEILFAGAWVTVAAVAVAFRSGRRISLALGGVGILAAAIPSVLFTLYFWTQASFGSAVLMAGRAWLSVLMTSRFTHETVQSGFLGWDAPLLHTWQHLWAACLGVLILGGILAGARITEAISNKWLKIILALAITVLVAWLSWAEINWPNSGKCLLGLGLLAIVLAAFAIFGKRADFSPQAVARFLFAVLAVSLLARMVLNGRVYQFGFYQAALAAVLVVSFLMGSGAGWAGGPWARRQVLAGAAALFLPGVVFFAGMSQRLYSLKTSPVGSGRDLFYAIAADKEPTGAIVNLLCTRLGQTAPSDTVLVLPEGEMINYLARRASPVAPFFFFSAAISGGREEALVRQLQSRPPQWVVIVSRDLREYGIQRYGEAPGKGALLMGWVDQNYQLAGRAGGDPLDVNDRGAVLLRRRN